MGRQVVRAEIVRRTDSGIHVRCEDGKPGFIPKAEICLRRDCSAAHRTDLGRRVDGVVTKTMTNGLRWLSLEGLHTTDLEDGLAGLLHRKEQLRVQVTAATKGGLRVSYKGLAGFMPASLIERTRVERLEDYVGRTLEARVVEIPVNGRDPVFDRRHLLEDLAQERRRLRLQSFDIGARKSARVVRVIRGTGIELAFDGVEGFVPDTEIAWQPSQRIDPSIAPGAQIDVVIQSVDVDAGRVTASIRALHPDPWISFTADRQVGDWVIGTVQRTTDFGSFVVLPEGLVGLVHASKYPEDLHKSDPPRPGEHAWVRITAIDDHERRITLSMRVPASRSDRLDEHGAEGAVSLAITREWAELGLEISKVGSWHQRGWTPSSAQPWMAAFDAESATRWRDAGWTPEHRPADWHQYFADPHEAAGWTYVCHDAATATSWAVHFTAHAAAEWLTAGVELDDARRWAAAGTGPVTAIEWEAAGWSSIHATSWWQAGFDPVDATEWNRAGLESTAARLWCDADWTAADAGPWHRHGFDPPEAAAWTAAGVTADQASALRGVLAPHDIEPWRRIGWAPADIAAWAPTQLSPLEARRWQAAAFAPEEAGRWCLHFAPDTAARWRAQGVSPEAAVEWAAAEVSPEVAAPWVAAGIDAATYLLWLSYGAELDDATVWSKGGLPPTSALEWLADQWPLREALRWAILSWSASDARAWRDAGFSASKANAWRSAGSPAVAAAWRALKQTPDSAHEWSRRRWQADEATSWIRRGWTAEQATAWRSAGWPDAVPATPWRDIGASAPVALRAHDAGLDADALGSAHLPAPPNPIPPAAKGTPADRLLGTPPAAELTGWTGRAQAHGSTMRRHSPSADERIEALLWKPPRRLIAEDAVRLMDGITSKLSARGWEGAAAGLLTAAMPILVAPSDARMRIEGESPPDDLLADVRLPFSAVAVVFGAPFELTKAHQQLLPSTLATSPSYQPWLAHLARTKGALRGVVMIAGRGGRGLADEVLWLLEIDGHQIPVPGLRSKSVMDPVVVNLAAALCWGGWARSLEGSGARRAPNPSRTAALSRTGAAPITRAVHVVQIRPRKLEHFDSTGFGAGRAAHIRRGHWKRTRIGPRDDWEYRWDWRDPTYVNGQPPDDTPRTVYRLPAWFLA